jgi:hypothetical protein
MVQSPCDINVTTPEDSSTVQMPVVELVKCLVPPAPVAAFSVTVSIAETVGAAAVPSKVAPSRVASMARVREASITSVDVVAVAVEKPGAAAMLASTVQLPTVVPRNDTAPLVLPTEQDVPPLVTLQVMSPWPTPDDGVAVNVGPVATYW